MLCFAFLLSKTRRAPFHADIFALTSVTSGDYNPLKVGTIGVREVALSKIQAVYIFELSEVYSKQIMVQYPS